jgi:hypothetical protein
MIRSTLSSIFLKHPEEKRMTYLEHLKHALVLGLDTLTCSIVFIIHGIVPALFQNTGSTMIKNLNEKLNKED